jgi:multisubunit Na+/H+ antiporter MnhB subunit
VGCVAFPVSLATELFQNPAGAFIAGITGGVSFLISVGVAKFKPELRAIIAYRIALVVTGLVLGVVA